MNIVLVIGNGFDLNLGLPTSFSHFIESEIYKSIISENELAKYLVNCYEANMGWVDIEYELSNYSMLYPSSKSLKDDFIELRQALADYIGEVEYNILEINKESQAYLSFGDYFFNSVGSNPTDRTTVINFNYTHSIQKIKRNLYGNGFLSKFMEIAEELSPLMGKESPFRNIEFLYPHGAVDTGIVFGVDDNAVISPKHTFLRKSACSSLSPFNPKILRLAQKVIIWGHSLGESDHAYFMDFFSKQASGESQRKEIVITYYGEDGFDSLISQLDILTNHNIRGLKVNNKLKLIDSSSDDCRWKI